MRWSSNNVTRNVDSSIAVSEIRLALNIVPKNVNPKIFPKMKKLVSARQRERWKKRKIKQISYSSFFLLSKAHCFSGDVKTSRKIRDGKIMNGEKSSVSAQTRPKYSNLQ